MLPQTPAAALAAAHTIFLVVADGLTMRQQPKSEGDKAKSAER